MWDPASQTAASSITSRGADVATTRASHAEGQRQRRTRTCGPTAGRTARARRSPRVSAATVATGRRIAAGLVAARQLAEDDADARARSAAQPELRQHAVDAIRTLADFVEEQDAAIRAGRTRRASPATPSAASACRRPAFLPLRPAFRISSRGCVISPAGSARQRQRAERVAIVPGLPARQPAFDHRPVKRHDAALKRQPGQDATCCRCSR